MYIGKDIQNSEVCFLATVSIQNNSAALYVCLASYTALYARGPELCIRIVCKKKFKEDGRQKLLADTPARIFCLPPSYPKK